MIRWRSLALAILASVALHDRAEARPPNVLLVVTDDQGYGDLGCNGNAQVRTPRIDALADQSARFRSFYVSPVCSPTRASLMTGRYSYRTGVVDTFRGRSQMFADEVTLAECLASAGYRTGIFGKWHLGDNAPMRAIDQGFRTALVCRGGGLGQGFEPPGGGSYFDPTLMRDGREGRTEGYCSDLFADAAIRFIEAEPARPFFAYLAFNAPHDPLEVPARDLDAYRDAPLDEPTKRVYAMVSNLDANLGRVLDRLKALGLDRDTIVVFLTDNGPASDRFNAGMRGKKATVFEGGIRVPCFVRWPGVVEPGREIEPMAAHIDLMPTLLAACEVPRPEGVKLDGLDLLPLLKDDSAPRPNRTLYFQWHRGDEPEFGRAFAARSDRYKLVQPLGVEPGPLPDSAHLELFDMLHDPAEEHDIAASSPDVVAELLRGYEAWFRDVTAPRKSGPPRIHLGSPRENPAALTRQDWRGPATEWNPGEMGGWDVEVVRPGTFDLSLLYVGGPPGLVRLELAGVERRQEIGPDSRSCRFEGVEIPAGPGRLKAWLERPAGKVGIYRIEMKRRD